MKYRKKPVVIEAIQWTGNNADEVECFTGEKNFYRVLYDNSLVIPMLEGDHKAIVGDWIIRGTQGEFYLCKPDIFKKTYEEVKEESKPVCYDCDKENRKRK